MIEITVDLVESLKHKAVKYSYLDGEILKHHLFRTICEMNEKSNETFLKKSFSN